MEPESRLSQLQSVLTSVGKETVLYESPDGSRVLQLLHGGRILGLFSASDDRNFYWTNAALESEASARELFNSNEWRDSVASSNLACAGSGHLFPEVSEPRDVDLLATACTGSGKLYSPLKSDGQFVGTGSLAVRRRVEMKISKWVGPSPNPLRYREGMA